MKILIDNFAVNAAAAFVRANPLDLKTALLAKHAQHVVLIHFPIALFITAVGFDYLNLWKKSRTLAAAAYFNLLLAAVFTLPVLATGLAAWQLALEGQKVKGILLLHLILALVTTVLLWLILYLHWRARQHPDQPLPSYRLPIEALAVLLISLTAHLGGFLSGVNATS